MTDVGGETKRALAGADLRGARLHGIDLRGADLWGANLAFASLVRADLRGARLSCASFFGADLRCARLDGADVRYCDFEESFLACASWTGGRVSDSHHETRALGAPSFADALAEQRCVGHLKRVMGHGVLLAVDAALMCSPDVEAELRGLLGADHWTRRVLALMAMARVRETYGLDRRALSLVGPRVPGQAAAALLLAAGVPERAIEDAYASLRDREHPGVWCSGVQRRLDDIRRWPPASQHPWTWHQRLA